MMIISSPRAGGTTKPPRRWFERSGADPIDARVSDTTWPSAHVFGIASWHSCTAELAHMAARSSSSLRRGSNKTASALATLPTGIDTLHTVSTMMDERWPCVTSQKSPVSKVMLCYVNGRNLLALVQPLLARKKSNQPDRLDHEAPRGLLRQRLAPPVPLQPVEHIPAAQRRHGPPPRDTRRVRRRWRARNKGEGRESEGSEGTQPPTRHAHTHHATHVACFRHRVNASERDDNADGGATMPRVAGLHTRRRGAHERETTFAERVPSRAHPSAHHASAPATRTIAAHPSHCTQRTPSPLKDGNKRCA